MCQLWRAAGRADGLHAVCGHFGACMPLCGLGQVVWAKVATRPILAWTVTLDEARFPNTMEESDFLRKGTWHALNSSSSRAMIASD